MWLLGSDPTLLHVHGGSVDGLLLCQTIRTGALVRQDAAPRPREIRRPHPSGHLPDFRFALQHQLVTDECPDADRGWATLSSFCSGVEDFEVSPLGQCSS